MNTTTATARTTITMDQTLLSRLKLFAQQRGETVSRVIEESVQTLLQEKTAKNKRYKQLFKLKGIGTSHPDKRNQSVDEILYGDQGAWRGSGG